MKLIVTEIKIRRLFSYWFNVFIYKQRY